MKVISLFPETIMAAEPVQQVSGKRRISALEPEMEAEAADREAKADRKAEP